MLITNLRKKFSNYNPFVKKDLITILKDPHLYEMYRNVCKEEVDEKIS